MPEGTEASDYFYSPESKVWEVNRENALVVFGGQRALLMQLAHPMVAQAVSEHSYFKENMIKRFQHTMEYTLSIAFGTHEGAHDAARKINQAHKGVEGVLAEDVGAHKKGDPYRAMDPKLLQWVWGTLVDSALVTHDKFVRPLSDEEKETFYHQSKQVLPLVGGNPEEAPETYEDFNKYMHQMIESQELRVGPTAEELGEYVMVRHIPGLNLLALPASRITVGILPEEIRRQYEEQYRLRTKHRGRFELKPLEKGLLPKVESASRAANSRLPDIARFTPKYNAAQKKLGK